MVAWLSTYNAALGMPPESVPRALFALAGGIFGGAVTGLVGWTGANLFGY